MKEIYPLLSIQKQAKKNTVLSLHHVVGGGETSISCTWIHSFLAPKSEEDQPHATARAAFLSNTVASISSQADKGHHHNRSKYVAGRTVQSRGNVSGARGNAFGGVLWQRGSLPGDL